MKVYMISGAASAPLTSNDFSLGHPFKTFSLVVRGAGDVSATVEIWWSPVSDRAAGQKIHTLSVSGTAVASAFESSEVCDGIWWAALTNLVGDTADVICGSEY